MTVPVDPPDPETMRGEILELLEGRRMGGKVLAELIPLARRCVSLAEIRDTLLQPPFEFTQIQVEQVLTLTLGDLSIEAQTALQAELDALRHGNPIERTGNSLVVQGGATSPPKRRPGNPIISGTTPD